MSDEWNRWFEFGTIQNKPFKYRKDFGIWDFKRVESPFKYRMGKFLQFQILHCGISIRIVLFRVLL